MKQFFFLPVFLLIGFSPIMAQDAAEEHDPIFGNTLPSSNRDPFAAPAQRGTGTKPPTGNTPSNSGVVSNPIDGGLSLLLATGALYGARRFRKAAKSA